MKRLEQEIRSLDASSKDFTDLLWFESRLMTLGNESIHVLFLAKKVDNPVVNLYTDFITRVIKPALESLPNKSTTKKEYVAGRTNIHVPARLYNP